MIFYNNTFIDKLPDKISQKLQAEVYFLYVVGDYPCDYKAYPSAEIDSYSLIGRSSLRDKKRLHIIGMEAQNGCTSVW